jgi:hypothetical protein
LSLNSQLDSAAQAKASDMVEQSYWSHTSPSGQSPWSLIISSGYQYTSAGENLAYGFSSSAQVMQAWLNSPEHRANILNASYRDVGFGIAQSNNYLGKGPATVVVAEYAQPLVAGAVTSGSTAVNTPSSQSVSRLQLLTGTSATLSELILSGLIGAALATFIIRHSLALHRFIRRGERFITSHPLLDILLVLAITIGFILSRHAGIIG